MVTGKKSAIHRREFLRLSLVAGAGAALAACGATATPVPAATKAPAAAATTAPAAMPTTVPTAIPTKPPAAMPSKFKESPASADLVKAGKLPAVDQRLPQDPLVLEPVESVGKYGGRWSFMTQGTGLSHWYQAGCNESWIRFNYDCATFRPNLLSSYKWNADATELTHYYRRGVKWSDGKPLTVDDWLFWWNDLAQDPTTGIPATRGCVVNGVPMKTEKVDEYTVKLTWVASNPLFMEINSSGGSGNRSSSWQVVQADYFKKYHYKYNTALKAGDTKELLDRYNNRGNYPETPYFGPWVTVKHSPDDRATAERNHYFWKVDTQGNQLPYIDGVDILKAKDPQLIVLKALAGDLSFQLRELSIKDTAIFMEGQAKGNYEVRMWDYGMSNRVGLHFHFSYKNDAPLVQLFWEKKFRQALSWAINRQRINDIVFLGSGRPRQSAMNEIGPEYKTPRGQQVLKDWEAQCLAYQPATAKQLLDSIGVVDKNNDGLRERPDGTKLELVVDVGVSSAEEVQAMTLIAEDWKAVGIAAVVNAIDGTVMVNRFMAGDSMMRVREIGGSGLTNGPYHWVPVEQHNGVIGSYEYGSWYQTSGKQGSAPPAGSPLEKLQKIYTEACMIVDPAKRVDRLLDAYQVHIDEGPIQIGCIGGLKVPVIVKKGLKNVLKNGPVANWVYGHPITADPEQWYWE